jgi:hypothetical protein
MPNKIPEYFPDRMSENLPNRISNRMLENISKDMTDRMPDKILKNISEYILENMLGRMSEDMLDKMSDRMPENISNKISEILLITKYINNIMGLFEIKLLLLNIFIGGFIKIINLEKDKNNFTIALDFWTKIIFLEIN